MSAPARLTAAGEIVRYDGAWQVPDATRKYNGFLRYSEGTAGQRLRVHRARLHELLALDRPDPAACRARRHRSTASAPSTRPTAATPSAIRCRRAGRGADEKSASKVEGYFIYSDAQPLQQFHLLPRQSRPTATSSSRPTSARSSGLNASHTQNHSFLGFEAATTLGTQFRYDDIAVGLFNTVQRMPTDTVRNDQVSETSIGLYAENKVKWTDWLRSTLGVRGDLYLASVDFRHGGELGPGRTHSSPAPRPGWCSDRSRGPSSI